MYRERERICNLMNSTCKYFVWFLPLRGVTRVCYRFPKHTVSHVIICVSISHFVWFLWRIINEHIMYCHHRWINLNGIIFNRYCACFFTYTIISHVNTSPGLNSGGINQRPDWHLNSSTITEVAIHICTRFRQVLIAKYAICWHYLHYKWGIYFLKNTPTFRPVTAHILSRKKIMPTLTQNELSVTI